MPIADKATNVCLEHVVIDWICNKRTDLIILQATIALLPQLKKNNQSRNMDANIGKKGSIIDGLRRAAAQRKVGKTAPGFVRNFVIVGSCFLSVFLLHPPRAAETVSLNALSLTPRARGPVCHTIMMNFSCQSRCNNRRTNMFHGFNANVSIVILRFFKRKITITHLQF